LKKEKFVLDHLSMKFWAFMKQYWRLMLVAIDIALISQLSGIGAYDFFSNQMFLNSGLTLANAQLYTTLTGIANILGALLTFYLVKKFTPKQVFMGGLYIVLATLVATALTIILDVWIITRYLIIFYCFVFSATLGSVVYILVPSLVPDMGCNIAFCFEGLAIFVIGYTFLYIKDSAIGVAGAFWIYAGFCAISIVHLTIELPETKGKTLDEVMLFFAKKPAPVREQAVESVFAPVVIKIEPEILEPVAASVVVVSDEQFKYARLVIPVSAKSLQMGMKGVAVPARMVKAHSENLKKNEEARGVPPVADPETV